jgi:hypothetical protein
MIMADEYCNTVVIDSERATEVERLGRSMVVAMGGSTNICLYPMHGRDAKRSIVRGTVSLALELGRTVREARTGGGDPFGALLRFLRGTQYYQHCRILFEGKTVDLLRETRGRLGIRQARHRRHRLRRPHGADPVPERAPRRARGERVLTIVRTSSPYSTARPRSRSRPRRSSTASASRCSASARRRSCGPRRPSPCSARRPSD